MRAASLFSGIGAPEVAMPGWQWLWHAEIEAFPSAVMAARHPGSINLGDVTAPDFVERARAFGPIDVLVAGWPCQDLSVAGKRAGLAGSRSGLFYSLMHIVESIEPRYLVLENVPGLLSINNGLDFQKVMEALSDAGYIVDVDVLDAQFFGVPQRRRRLFWACVRLDVSLRMKTPFSAHIAAECVAQTLRDTWGALLAASSAELPGSGCENQTEPLAESARKKINAFAKASGGEACMSLLESWGGQFRRSMGEPSFLAWISSLPQERQPDDFTAGTGTSALNATAPAIGLQSTGSLWSELLDAASTRANGFTTSIWTSKTTDRKTLAFAKASVITAKYIINSAKNCNDEVSSSDLWSLASSVLTLLESVTTYARQSVGTIFAWHEHAADWWACVDEARTCAYEAHRCIGNRPDPGALFLIAKGMSGHPAPGDEARQAVAGSLGAGSKRSGGRVGRREAAAGHVVGATVGSYGGGLGELSDISPSLQASGGEDQRGIRNPLVMAFGGNNTAGPVDIATACNAHGGPHGRLDFESETFVAHSLRADGFDASEDGTGRGTPLVPVTVGALAAMGTPNGHGFAGLACSQSVAAGHIVPVAMNLRGRDGGAMPECDDLASVRAASGGSSRSYVAFDWQSGGDARGLDPSPLTRAMQANQVQAVHSGMAVRRLTPREAERLQGFPDDFTLIKYRGKDAADGPRYKACGNSMAVPCIRWILDRIERCDAALRLREAA